MLDTAAQARQQRAQQGKQRQLLHIDLAGEGVILPGMIAVPRGSGFLGPVPSRERLETVE